MPLPYPKTTYELIQGTLSRVNQDLNANTAELDPGTGATATISTADQVLLYLNGGQNELARRCYQIDDNGTYTTPIGTLLVPYSALTTVAGHTVWGARRVLWNGTNLDHMSRSELELWYQATYPTDTGTPLYWTEAGSEGIILYPTPSSQQTTKVYGFCYPKPLVNYLTAITAATNANPSVITTGTTPHNLVTGTTVYIAGALGATGINGYNVVTVVSATTFSVPVAAGGAWTSGGTVADVPTWFQADREKLLEYHAASQYARKNLGNDATLSPLVMQAWEQEWERGKERLLEILFQQDPTLCRYHFGVPQSAMAAQPQAPQG